MNQSGAFASKTFHRGDDLENYLNNLTQNPDKAGYYVDGDGNVSRKDEFNI